MANTGITERPIIQHVNELNTNLDEEEEPVEGEEIDPETQKVKMAVRQLKVISK